MTGCWICLDLISPDKRHHPACLRRLFGRPHCPHVDLGGMSLTEAIADQSDRISISGVQAKLVVDAAEGGTVLRPRESGRYILKVPVPGYKSLLENEHLTMTLARLVGLAVPDCGLLPLPDGEPAYLVKRFDRTDDRPPRKLRQEDFCSLLQRDPAQKYQATAEECADVVRKYSAEPAADLRRLFAMFLFAYWIGNDDLHLKNLSLTQSSQGPYVLSMAYDLVCTRLYPKLRKEMALPLGGRRQNQHRRELVAFARSCDVTATEAAAEIARLRSAHRVATEVVDRSPLPEPFRLAYKRELAKRDRALGGKP